MSDITPFQSGAPLPIESLAAQLRPLSARTAPQQVRERIAKALVPAPPDVLVPALVFLCQDPEEAIRKSAQATIATMPDDVMLPLVQATTDPGVLDGLARVLHKTDEASRAIALNSATADDTIRYLAGVASTATCDIIARNQVRAMRYPAIVEAIYLNPRARHGVVQDLLDMAVRSALPLEHMPGFREAKALLLGEEKDDTVGGGLSDMEFASAMLMAIGQDGPAAPTEEAAEEKKVSTLQALIMRMNVSQKVRLASVGDGAVRKLLIRDPKKVVAFAVLRSPRLTEGEVTMFAGNKALAEDLIAMIARNRMWTKDYSTRRALVFNPKTPIQVSLNFLRTLSGKDVKEASMSRDINGTVQRAARRMIVLRDGPKK